MKTYELTAGRLSDVSKGDRKVRGDQETAVPEVQV